MPKCPACKEEIDHLLFIEDACDISYFSLKDNKPYYEFKTTEYSETIDYVCPLCDSSIASSEKEAEAFLKENNYSKSKRRKK